MKIIKISLLLIALITSYVSANMQKPVLMATTTSTENSGLLDYLLPLFEKTHSIKIKAIATGTGKALKLAENGDVDIVMVHAPKKEQQFIKNSFGIHRKTLMHNLFFIVGPKSDPAGIKNVKNVINAFANIKKTQSLFISRGDHSGTHFKELSIWQKQQIPKKKWYKAVGQGMGKTLQIADQLNAYTLVDQGTWLKLKDKLQLALLYYGDPMLFNPYSVILVNPKRHPKMNFKPAKIFADWLTSADTKAIINRYQVSGQQLFFAN